MRPGWLLTPLRRLAIDVADQVQGVHAPVHCDSCQMTRTHITPKENAILHVHKHLLCPCGGTEVFIGSERLDEPAAVFQVVA